MAARNPRLAVLIDGDNVSPDMVDRLFEAIGELGDATVRTVYGSQTGSKKWRKATERHALSFGRRIPQATGTNATDIEMVIGAMDILVQDMVDGFCIASSDADFTPLAIRLREAGKLVYGYGANAPERLRKACHDFIPMHEVTPPSEVAKVVAFPQAKPKSVTPEIRRAISKHNSDDGWVPLSVVGTELAREIPGFKAKNYGAPLSKLAQQAGATMKNGVKGQSGVCVRLQ